MAYLLIEDLLNKQFDQYSIIIYTSIIQLKAVKEQKTQSVPVIYTSMNFRDYFLISDDMVIIMQNLQIYYAETSPHIEYLQQFNLLDETEVNHHFDSTHHYESMETFGFIQKKYQQQQQSISYDEWITKLIVSKRLNCYPKIKAIVICLTYFICGDILEYAYKLSNMTQINANKQLKRLRWQIILRLLLLFIISIYIPWIVLALVYIIYNKIIPNQIQTSIDCSLRLKRQLNSAVNDIKFMFLEQFRSIPNLKNELLMSVNNLLSFISHTYNIERTYNQYVVDQLDQIIFKTNHRRKQNNFAEKFLTSHSHIKRIILYWQLNNQNQRIKQLISHIHSIHILYQIRKEDQFNYSKQRTTINYNLYYHILIDQLAKLQKNELQTETKKNLISVLKREIELKQMFHTRYCQQPIYSQTVKDEQEIIQFKKQQIDHKRYMCYKDESVQEYIPSSTKVIKQQLEKMLKRQQQGEAEERSSSQQNEIRSISSEESIYKQERFSFGFAIAPPARDMSAYYLD